MKLSDGEKLILVMLTEIYKKLGIKGEIDGKFVQSAIFGGHLWGLKWRYPGIFDNDEPGDATVREVGDILDMWWLIELGYAKLSKAEKAKLAASDAPFSKDVSFRGFDGNNEGRHLSVAGFLIDNLDRFTYFKGRELNSHMPVLGTYRRMFELFEPMRKKLADKGLSVDEIIALLKAAQHPDSRRAA